MDLSAPGGNASNEAAEYIRSSYNEGRRAPGDPGDGYLAGTLMSTPHVASVVALMQSIKASTSAGVQAPLNARRARE